MKSIKIAIQERRFAEALSELTQLAASLRDPLDLTRVARLIDQIPVAEIQDVLRAEGYLFKKLAVLTGYTSQPVTTLVRARALASKIIIQTHESDYGSFEADLFRRDPRLVEFAPDLVFFCVGTEHLRFSGAPESESARWQALWKAGYEFLGCPVIQNTFEEPTHLPLNNFERKHAQGSANFVRRLNGDLAQAAPAFVHFNDVDRLAAHHGRKNWRDERLFDLSKIPVSDQHVLDYADNLVSVIAAIFGRARKCLVLDLDNTLWGGIIGDDGPAGIDVAEGSATGEAHRRFQRYVKSLKQRGVILAVCSKNDETIAREAFTQNPDMILSLDDISCFVANWEPKHQNIALIAKTLNIGLDSLVFADDNPAEREIVRKNLPQVAVLDLPADPAGYTLALSQCGHFETVTLTEEDLARTEQYRGNANREVLLAQSGNYDDFLRGLEMKAVCSSFEPQHLPRIAQLINKTNQFNVTTPRYTDAEVKRFSQDPNALTRYVRLRDKFGDNGLISVMIGLLGSDKAFTIDTWLMSCRVLKRDVEGFLFRDVLRELLAREATLIRGTFKPTAKNKLVEKLFAELGFDLESKKADGTTHWIFDLKDQERVEKSLSAPEFVTKVSEYQ